MVTDFRMPKLGFGRRRSAEVLDGALGKWSLDSVKPGFALPQPRASSLLSWGSRFLQVSRAGFRTNSSSATVKHKLITSAALVLSYTFSIQYQAGSGCKTRTPAQHTHYHLPPASSELSKSSSAEMEHTSGTVHTCFKLQNPLQEACASIIRGVVELR